MKKLAYILLAVSALAGAYVWGGFTYHPNSVESPFRIEKSSKLFVTDVWSGFEWYSLDSTIIAKVDYLRLGEKGSCYQLRLIEHGRSSYYYGGMHIDNGADDVASLMECASTYYFADDNDGSLIVIYDGEMPRLVLRNETIPIIYNSQFD